MGQNKIPFAGPVRPIDEPDRVATLLSIGVLDTDAEAPYDLITATAARLCTTPIAMVSLVDSQRQWLKSSIGVQRQEIPRDLSLCSYAIIDPQEPLIVEDTERDSRFSQHPLVVGKPFIRFYAGTPLVMSNGSVLGTLCVMDYKPRTLTETQEEGLRELGNAVAKLLEQRLSDTLSPLLGRAIEKLSIGITVIDVREPGNKIIYCNPSFEQLSGYSRHDVIGQRWRFLDGDDTSMEQREKLRQARENQEECSVTLKSYRKDGSAFWNDVSIFPIHNEQGRVDHYFSVHQDATRRHNAEIRSLEFGSVLENSLNEIYICDAETRRFLQVNKGARRNLGYTMKELSEMTPLEIGHNVTEEELDELVKNISDQPGTKFVYELSNRRKDGSTYRVELHVQQIEFDGRPVILGINLDISQRKQAERLLREANEKLEQRVRERTAQLEATRRLAERANEGKSRFLAAASHDLRQPLQAMRLYLSALSLRLDDPKARQLGEKMQLSLDSMGGLLDSLLDLASLESGSVKPNMQNVVLNDVFDRLEDANQQLAHSKGLTFECQRLDCVIHTDPALLERIIENYISNAIRYTEKGQVYLTANQLDGFVRISVTDSGVGIEDSKLPDVFEEYYQVDNPARDQRNGLGLGLSIVKHIAQLLKHPTHVCSALGEGSTFSVDVSLGKTQSVTLEPHTIDVSSLRELNYPKLLVIDDDPDIMDAMIELISAFNVELHTAMSGEEALAQIREGLNPDLVISDYRMPGMNGVEVVQAIRAERGAELPVILMTGDTSAQSIKDAKLENCDVFLKPISVQALMPLLRHERSQ